MSLTSWSQGAKHLEARRISLERIETLRNPSGALGCLDAGCERQKDRERER